MNHRLGCFYIHIFPIFLLLGAPPVRFEVIFWIYECLIWYILFEWSFGSIISLVVSSKTLQLSRFHKYFLLQHFISKFQAFQAFNLFSPLVYFYILNINHSLLKNIVPHFLLREGKSILMRNLGCTCLNLSAYHVKSVCLNVLQLL